MISLHCLCLCYVFLGEEIAAEGHNIQTCFGCHSTTTFSSFFGFRVFCVAHSTSLYLGFNSSFHEFWCRVMSCCISVGGLVDAGYSQSHTEIFYHQPQDHLKANTLKLSPCVRQDHCFGATGKDIRIVSILKLAQSFPAHNISKAGIASRIN